MATKAPVAVDLHDRVFLVTGANTGIGLVTARELARAGAHVVCACRSEAKAQPVIDAIKAETGNDKVDYLRLDLGSLASAREAADAFVARGLPLHGLINNAGVAAVRGLTADGFEHTFGTNHLGHYLFTNRLLDVIKRSAPSRIVNVASTAHYNAKTIPFDDLKTSTPTISGMPEYSVSKLANVLHAKSLAKRLKDDGVTTSSLHPGVVASDIWERRLPRPIAKFIGLFMINTDDGALTTLHCATAPGLETKSGAYFDSCKEKTPSRPARDEALAEMLWERSEAWVAPFNA